MAISNSPRLTSRVAARVALAGLVACALLAQGSACAQTAVHGWFWYQEPPPPPASAPVSPKPPPKPAVKQPEPPKPVASAPTEPVPLSVVWIKRHLESYRVRAIDDPTVQNVGAYLALQKVMFDKSNNFAAVAKTALRDYPALDPGTFIPTDQASLAQFDAYREQVKPAAMKLIASKAGLWFFFDSTCTFCTYQAQQMGGLHEEYPDMAILPISTDGKPLPGTSPGALWVPDSGQAKKLDVQLTPTVVLVWPPNHFALVAQGAMTQAMLEKNIIEVAADHGLLPKSWQAWVDPYQRGVLTPEQIDAANKNALKTPQDLLQYVTVESMQSGSR
jgi:conjugal transfer pilus assembly protein TraF